MTTPMNRDKYDYRWALRWADAGTWIDHRGNESEAPSAFPSLHAARRHRAKLFPVDLHEVVVIRLQRAKKV